MKCLLQSHCHLCPHREYQIQHDHSAMTTTAPQKAVHGTHWCYNGSVKSGMHLATKAVAFAEVALCYMCVFMHGNITM